MNYPDNDPNGFDSKSKDTQTAALRLIKCKSSNLSYASSSRKH